MPGALLSLAIGLLGLGFMVEMVLYLVAPHLYARAALVPLAPSRRLPLEPAARAALVEVTPGVGYRDGPSQQLVLSRMSMVPRLEIDGLVVHSFPARGLFVARLPWTMSNRTLAMARIDLTEADGALELRSRFVVMGWPSLAIATPLALLGALLEAPAAELGMWLGMGAFFVFANGAIGWLTGRARVTAAVDVVQRQLGFELGRLAAGR